MPVSAVQDKRLFETILSSVADGVFTVDRNWLVTSFNRAAERITGISAEQAIGRVCSEVFHADICERRCALRDTLRNGHELVDVPARILDSRGRSVPISLSTGVLRDPKGELIGAVETFRDLSDIEQLRREITSQYTFEDIVGKSAAFKKIFAILPDIAESDATVLIEGPSGSGKELLARAVHNLSHRRARPYVAVNCGTLPAPLFESELFGYTRGAFTGARSDKPGRFDAAEGGTIFFDEISELPPETQVKLLRVLQERQFQPLGAQRPQQANVRVVATTNRKLADWVSKGQFRDDLYFRLAVVRIEIPPLAERREDIHYLVEHFIKRFNAKQGKTIAGVSAEVMEILMRHDFPGNVRELENVIEHGFVLCHDELIDLRHLPEHLQKLHLAPPPPRQEQVRRPSQLQWVEAEVIRTALKRNLGSISETASELHISRTTLWRKMKKYAISSDEYRGEHVSFP